MGNKLKVNITVEMMDGSVKVFELGVSMIRYDEDLPGQRLRIYLTGRTDGPDLVFVNHRYTVEYKTTEE